MKWWNEHAKCWQSMSSRSSKQQRICRPVRPLRPTQLTIFTPLSQPVLEKLREVDLNRLTPLEALNLLAELKKGNLTTEDTRERTQRDACRLRSLGQLLIVGFDGAEMTPRLASLLKRLQPAGVILFARNIQSSGTDVASAARMPEVR